MNLAKINGEKIELICTSYEAGSIVQTLIENGKYEIYITKPDPLEKIEYTKLNNIYDD